MFLEISQNLIKKEILAQVFSCEFCEISKNTFFTEHLWATASEKKEKRCYLRKIIFKTVGNIAEFQTQERGNVR